jgi:hypothetical protein
MTEVFSERGKRKLSLSLNHGVGCTFGCYVHLKRCLTRDLLFIFVCGCVRVNVLWVVGETGGVASKAVWHQQQPLE